MINYVESRHLRIVTITSALHRLSDSSVSQKAPPETTNMDQYLNAVSGPLIYQTETGDSEETSFGGGARSVQDKKNRRSDYTLYTVDAYR